MQVQAWNHDGGITPNCKDWDSSRFSQSRNLSLHFPLSAPVMDIPQLITEECHLLNTISIESNISICRIAILR